MASSDVHIYTMGSGLHNKNLELSWLHLRSLCTHVDKQGNGERIHVGSGFSYLLSNSTGLHCHILSFDWNTCVEKESCRNAGEQGRKEHQPIENKNCKDAYGSVYYICPLLAPLILFTAEDIVWTRT